MGGIEMKKFIFFLITVTVLCSCGDFLLNEDYRGGDWFYLENKGATMPVWVNGNKQSKTFIIFLHGGPGDTAMIMPLFDALIELQKDYAIVYYDQRSSGVAQGNAKPDSFKVEQMVEDLEKLVVLIQHKYNNPAIFLMGISWGGTLGTAFLVNPINQTHISGWIEIDGGHNLRDGMAHSAEWVITMATEQINQGNNTGHWNKEIAWYNTKPDLFDFKKVERHAGNVEKLNGYAYNPSNSIMSLLPMPTLIFSSPYNLFFESNKKSLTSVMWRRLENINFVPEMHKITIPSLILWGRHDGILPVVQAFEAYDNIGSVNKYIHIFEKSAHNPIIEEPELFVQKVKEFINKYKGM